MKMIKNRNINLNYSEKKLKIKQRISIDFLNYKLQIHQYLWKKYVFMYASDMNMSLVKR